MAGVFYKDFFCRLEEEPFSVRYADIPSRPNIPVNVIVGLEYLKAGFGWSDEELYDAFIYNMQVRYVLDYQQLGEGDFELHTLNNFRQRLSRHMQDMEATVLAIDDSGDDIPADNVVEIQSGSTSLEGGPLLLQFLQLLPYYRSMEKGLNPDRPKNLDAVVVL